MFTDRFLEIPLILYDTNNSEIVGYTDATKSDETFMKVNPFEISHYRPCPNDNQALVRTLVQMKNADTFEADMTIDEFEKRLNDHQKS